MADRTNTQLNQEEPWPQSKAQFLEWFWRAPENRESILTSMNKARGRKHESIRREMDSPTIFGITLNSSLVDENQWTLCKVGVTYCNASHDNSKWITQLLKTIPSKFNSSHKATAEATATVLFKFEIGPLNITQPFGLKKKIKLMMGMPVPQAIAERCNLVTPTDWVLMVPSTRDFIEEKVDENNGQGTNNFKDLELIEPAEPEATQFLNNLHLNEKYATKYEDYEEPEYEEPRQQSIKTEDDQGEPTQSAIKTEDDQGETTVKTEDDQGDELPLPEMNDEED